MFINKRRAFITGISAILALVLLIASAGSVLADQTNPTVTPLSGDLTFTTTIVPVTSLPGTYQAADGMYFPVGFKQGEKQFSGAGVQVSGLALGTAKVCFPINGVSEGWGGKVGSWDGKKWTLLETTITTPKESTYSLACSTIASNGVYALLYWVADPSKLPANDKPDCGYTILGVLSGTPTSVTFPPPDLVSVTFTDVQIGSSNDLTGKLVTFSILGYDSDSTFTFGPSLTGTLSKVASDTYLLHDPTGMTITGPIDAETHSTSMRLDFGSCKQDYTIVYPPIDDGGDD